LGLTTFKSATMKPSNDDTPAPSDTSLRGLDNEAQQLTLPCVMTFNANDPSGAGGLCADITAMSSASVHVLPVVAALLIRDTSHIQDHITLDEDSVTEQARVALEDIEVGAFKVGFLGNPTLVSAVAHITNDYEDVPVVAYMPDLAWMDELELDNYLDAFADLMLPQTAVLVGNYNTLCRWLLPDWTHDKPPSPRDVARAATDRGAVYTLVTGMNAPDQFLENHLATAETILATAKFERFETVFTGAGDTLSASLCALLATGEDLQSACAEALTYLDQSLDAGFAPGMGHALPDRMFWAREDVDEAEVDDSNDGGSDNAATSGDVDHDPKLADPTHLSHLPPNQTKH
jgi:hydroxymethylpyrimidine/phosphomethylpyrimidine kinase